MHKRIRKVNYLSRGLFGFASFNEALSELAFEKPKALFKALTRVSIHV